MSRSASCQRHVEAARPMVFESAHRALERREIMRLRMAAIRSHGRDLMSRSRDTFSLTTTNRRDKSGIQTMNNDIRRTMALQTVTGKHSSKENGRGCRRVQKRSWPFALIPCVVTAILLCSQAWACGGASPRARKVGRGTGTTLSFESALRGSWAPPVSYTTQPIHHHLLLPCM